MVLARRFDLHCLLLAALCCAPSVRAATFVVNTTDDTGAGTLRQAITDANASPGADTIEFAISDAGVPRITPQSALPNVTGPVVLDATTQQPAGRVELDGSSTSSVSGLTISGGGTTVRGLVVNGFQKAGIYLLGGSGNTVEGCLIGTDPTGTIALSPSAEGIDIDNSSGNRIGGTSPGKGNLISGNQGGISIHGSLATGNQIEGNLIGTDTTGNAAVGNAIYGVRLFLAPGNVIGGTSPGARNVISGNAADGLVMTGSGTQGNLAQGNVIGMGQDLTTPLPNGRHGVLISTNAHHNTVGGTAAGAGNTIARNVDHGVVLGVTSGVGNTIRGNSISANGRLGIDGGPSGVTANDAGDIDTGANLLQNFPVLDAAFAGGASVSGTLDTTPSADFTVEIFASSQCDSSGHGEGAELVGVLMVTTDASGLAAFNASLTRLVVSSEVLTATATDTAGNTSEFSACAPTPAPSTTSTSTTSTTTTSSSSTSSTDAPTTSSTTSSTTSTTSEASTTSTSEPDPTSTTEPPATTTSTTLPEETTTTSSTAPASTSTSTSLPTTTSSTTTPEDTTSSTTSSTSTSTSTLPPDDTTSTTALPTTSTSSSSSTSSTSAPDSTSTTTSSTSTTTIEDGSTSTIASTSTSSSTTTTVEDSTSTTATSSSTTTLEEPGSTTTSSSTTSTLGETSSTTSSSTTSTILEPPPTSSTLSSTSTSSSSTTSTVPEGTTTTTLPAAGCGTDVACDDPRCAGSERCPTSCSEDATFAGVGCRLDVFRTKIGQAPDLGSMRPQLDQQLGRARLLLDKSEQRCAAAARRPARAKLRRSMRRLAVVRYKLLAGERRGLVPPTVTTPLIGTAENLIGDARTLRTSIRCE